jgi:hypothetical protein
MRKEPITLDHLSLLSSRFANLNVNLSEYSFANIYLFREVHQYKLVTCHNLFITGKTRDGVFYIMPTVVPEQLDICRLRRMLKCGHCVFPIAEEWLPYFNPRHFYYTYSEDDSDYLFTTNKMRTYSGRALSGRRNLVKQFLNQYAVESYALNNERTHDAISALEKWALHKKIDRNDTDYAPCLEGLRLFDQLRFTGKIYYVQKEPVAFIFGEQLNGSVYVFHFAKADTAYKGIYQYVYQDFSLGLPEGLQFINLEQDLGLSHIRRSKNAYMPDHRIKKYRVFPRKKEE